MLQAIGIEKSYNSLHVLKGIDLEIKAGEVIALVGSSGAGKSTLLQILGTLDYPDKGKILFEGNEIHGLSAKAQALFRNHSLGFVFQFHHLLPEFTALENVCMPAFIAGMPVKQAEHRAEQLLNDLGVLQRKDHKPSQLSGGEQQRVSVARALMNQPKLVLADEPTGNLDTTNSESLYKLFFDLSRSMNVGFLIATHNEHLASISDKVIHIKDGLKQ